MLLKFDKIKQVLRKKIAFVYFEQKLKQSLILKKI